MPLSPAGRAIRTFLPGFLGLKSMPLQRIRLQARASDSGLRLDQFLAARLPEALGQPLSRARVRKLIVAGAVYLNGRRVRIASKTLVANARVDACVDREKLLSGSPATDRPFEMTGADILYEDDHLIAVNKPAGLPTQPTLDEARDNLFAAIRRFLAARAGTAGIHARPYLGLHHRLDRDTSGVVLLTKSPDANPGVSELFSRHLVVKTYEAVSSWVGEGEIPARWAIENHLGRDRSKSGKQSRFTAVRSGGDFARTEFELLEEMSDGVWVRAFPRTGRTHQIRVHLSEFGLPILGDPVYGVPHPDAPRVLLHAVSLTFPHPIHKTEILVQSPLPEDFVGCLRALKSRKIS